MAGTISFNDYENVLGFYYYKASTAAFTTRNKTTGDYFADDCAVGDCLYFPSTNSTVYSACTFKNLKLYIGTAFAADAVTFVWEYASGSSSWTALPDLVDNSSGFTLTGERIVEWTVPTDWRYLGSPVPSQNYPFFIRCRITAITSPTEGGKQSTQAVQVGNNSIYASDFETDDPCTFEKLYQADVTGGWGKITKAGNFYDIDCNLRIDHYFVDKQKAVAVNGLTEFYNEANITFGENTGGYRTKNGVFFRSRYPLKFTYANINTRDTANLNFYSCLFQADYAQRCQLQGNNINIYNSEFNGFTTFSPRSTTVAGTTKLFNVVVSNCSYIEGSFGEVSEISDIKMYDCGYIIYSIPALSYEITIRGLYTINTNLMVVWSPNIYHLVDCTLGNRIMYWVGSEPLINSLRVYLEYSLALKVQDKTGSPISGATVAIVDVNGDAISASPLTTDSNGDITPQDLLQYEIKHKVGSGVGAGASYTDETLYTPHTITISAPGYQTKTMVLDMDRKREEVVVLEKAVDLFIVGGEPKLNIEPENSQNNILV